MALPLTKADVERLLIEPSPLVRALVADKIALVIDDPVLTPAELALAQDIVRLMVKDVEVKVRLALAKNLRNARNLPHEAALALANDIEAVALPILNYSRVLTDADLIDIIRKGSAVKQAAIAQRETVSEAVAESLIAAADDNAVSLLFVNKGAKIAESGFVKAVERFADNDNVKTSMVRCPTLPPVIAEKLVVMVSEELRNYLVEHHHMESSTASSLAGRSREQVVATLGAGASEKDIVKLVTQLHRNRRLSPATIFHALLSGDAVFFEASLAVKAGVSVDNVRILINDAGQRGLKSLCERAEIPSRLMNAVRLALEAAHGMPPGMDRKKFQANITRHILEQCKDLKREDLE